MKQLFYFLRIGTITALLLACTIPLFARKTVNMQLAKTNHLCGGDPSYSSPVGGGHLCSNPIQTYTYDSQ